MAEGKIEISIHGDSGSLLSNLSGDLRKRLMDLAHESRKKFNYVIARSHMDKTKAFNSAGLGKTWYYNLSQAEQDELEAIAAELNFERSLLAEKLLEYSVVKAALTKIDGLELRDHRLRQMVATEILDRVLGKPKQQTVSDIKVTTNWRDFINQALGEEEVALLEDE